jgi:membrane peptidoglycan carboxypeptidase
VTRKFATRRMLRDRIRGRNGHNGDRPMAPRWLQVAAGIVGIGFVGMALVGLTGYGVYYSYASGLQPPDEVIASQPSGGAMIYDRNGNLLYQYVDDRSGLRSPVKLEDISPWMIAATISTEDFGYWSNPGVNMRGLARAGAEAVGLRESGSGDATGGSSITMQLVKNIYIDPEERIQRSYTRKLKETIFAIELTNKYTKDQILEWYLNQISYGGLYNGVEAAAQGYFGKSAKDLNLPEAALLAGIPASPVRYDPINNPESAVERRNEVLRLMQTRDRVTITDEDGERIPAVRFQVNDDGDTVDVTNPMFFLSTLAPLEIEPQRFPVQAPHWVFTYIEPEIEARFGQEALYRGGLRVTTTLDLDLQRQAQDALETWIREFEASAGGHNGSFVAIDPRTSEILVMVGSRDYFRDDIDGRVNNAIALNSPGSTLKPFTYASAFERLNWGDQTLILDTPISYPDGDRTFTPRNPNGGFVGRISVRNALGNSLNIPPFKTALYVGVPDLLADYKKFGMTTFDEGPFGPSVTLGGGDVTLVDVTYAYSVLAGDGVMRGVPTTRAGADGNRNLDPVSILQITRTDGSVLYPESDDHRVHVQEERIISSEHAYMINSILSDPSAQCITFGCGGLSIGRQAGIKTGTSEPFENSTGIGETWTYIYTPEMVAGVWFGNSDNTPMFNITSTSVSYRAARQFMMEVLTDVPASQFQRPPGLTEVDICLPSGLKATDDCGLKVRTMMPHHTVPEEDDDWWTTVQIDSRNGLLASAITPSQFVVDRRVMNIPESVTGFARTQAEEWARFLRVGVAPTERSDGSSPVRIQSPSTNQVVSGIVSIQGSAASDDFIAYRVEVGEGSAPSEWSTIIRSESPQSSGGLALWNTSNVEDGTYTIRLVLEDRVRGDLSTFVTVRVQNDEPDDDDDDDDNEDDDEPEARAGPGPPPHAGARGR